MGTLTEKRIAELLAPYLDVASGNDRSESCLASLSTYLDLLLRWNVRTNLTAIREPEEIVRRHFGESIFTATKLQMEMSEGANLLDFGSGAGFPGLPIQLYLPELSCTLAESQGKKAAFLREATRTLRLATQVWAGRVEAMPAERKFWCVTMRAVDDMRVAVPEAAERVAPRGILAVLSGEVDAPIDGGFALTAKFSIPGSNRRMLYLYARQSSPPGE